MAKTQVTSSPSAMLIAFAGLPSLHTTGLVFQPSVGTWTTEYTPVSSCPVVRWRRSLNLKSNDRPLGRLKTKAKLVGSPVGVVCTWTMIFALEPAAWTPTARVTTRTAIAVQIKRRRARRAALLGAVLLVI
jgi:hypothetical protein